MKLETIYNELKNIIDNGNDFNFIKYMDLMEKIEKAIRTEASYKTSSKTRVSAIKRVASKQESRPALKGYGFYEDYKVVTDSYHLIAIHQDVMPIPLVGTKEDLQSLGIDYKDYMEKYGRESIINATYPNLKAIIGFNRDNELPMIDMDDLLAFIKTHKKEKNPLYQIGECYYNPQFVKNVVDVLGKDLKIWYQGEYKPLYFENKNGEFGLVLPIKKY